MSDQVVPSSRRIRELRLALVCYGGVSLAVYMHGITKEIQKLIVASTRFEQSPEDNPFDEGCSEHIYWNLLRKLRDSQRDMEVPTRVVVDIISGTSAGGINGVCLAKALATNRSQDTVKDVWFDKGDIRTLLHGPRRLPPVVRFPLWSVTSLFGWPRSFLRGDAMCQWLFNAMEEIDQSLPAVPNRDSLVPEDDPSLQLFVPITDFRGYVRMIALDDPKTIYDRTHRHILPFDFAVIGRDGFTGKANHALAFAARATSSFPGAFAAISVDDYATSVAGGEQLRDALGQMFKTYEDLGADPKGAWFVDGGVLDNLPFKSAIDAIRLRPASTEVDRRLLFIDPDPQPIQEAPLKRSPGWLSTAVQSIASIPRAEPIVDDLLQLVERNETVARIREIIETAFSAVTDIVTTTVAEKFGWQDPQAWPTDPTLEQIRGWRSALEDAAQTKVGPSYFTYIRLRLANVLDSYARQIVDVVAIPWNVREGAFVRSALRRRAAHRGLVETSSGAIGAQRQFLREFDLSYHERGLRLLVAGLSWWYRDQGSPDVPRRDALDEVKRSVYNEIAALRRAGTQPRTEDDFVADLREVFDPQAIRELLDRVERGDVRQSDHADSTPRNAAIDEFLSDHEAALDEMQNRLRDHVARAVSDVERNLYDELATNAGDWPARARQDLLVRYLGLPFWDALIYPIQALSGVGERDHVEVSRISPADARLLSHGQPKPRGPLAGVSLHHFGAFRDRGGREHDYLWGRLDAAERLITLLFDDPYAPGLTPADPDHCAAAFQAIVNEERGLFSPERERGLRNTNALDDVDHRIAHLGGGPVTPAAPVVEAAEPMDQQ